MHSSSFLFDGSKLIPIRLVLFHFPKGGGRGCRVVRHIEDVSSLFDSAASEALFAFGDASLLIERLVERPRHIEIQIFGDRFDGKETDGI